MNIALILSGGTGSRLGADVPKQYIEVQNKPVIAYAVEAFLHCPQIDKIHIVAEESWQGYIEQTCLESSCDIFAGFSSSGETRQLSILNGLRDIKKYADDDADVIIHDAARPFVKVETIKAIIEKLGSYDAVTPVLPVKDTVYIYENNGFVSTADRSKLVAGQTPEGFKLGKYLKATESLLPDMIYNVTGSLQVALDGGLTAASVCGDEDNFKITTQKDLEKFINIIE